MAFWNRRKEKVETRAPDPWPPFSPRYYGSNAGPVANEATFLGIASAWRGVDIVCNAIATLPIHGYRDGEKIEPTPSILLRPNVQETRVESIYSMMQSLLLRGNAFALYGDYDYLNFPRQLMVLDPDLVVVRRDVDGNKVYKVGEEEFSAHEVMHVRGHVVPGAMLGLGIIEAHRQGIGHAIALQEYSQRYFAESATPPGVLHVNALIEREEAQALKQEWVATHGHGNREPAVLGKDVEFKPLSFSPEDSQFLQSRQFSLIEIAHMVGVPPYFLGAQAPSMTYSNVEQEALNFVRWSLRGWIARLEEAFSQTLPRGQEAKFNLDALLRADTKTRYEAHQIALGSGFLTQDEVRALEDRKPLPQKEVKDAGDGSEEANADIGDS